jgi:hypothetical protein
MTAEQYVELMAFDAIEPLNVADRVMMRMFGGGKEQEGTAEPSVKPWQIQKMKMLQHIAIVRGAKSGGK